MIDGCEDTDLVESVVLLFLAETGHSNLFESVDLIIGASLDLVHCGVTSLTNLVQNNEVF